MRQFVEVNQIHERRGRARRWRCGALALALAGAMALPLSQGHAADDIESTPSPQLIATSYDVIIVPRPGSRSPRVLTDRGWQSLYPRTPQRREAGTYQPRFFGGRWSGRAGRSPATEDRMPYDARTGGQSRSSRAWSSQGWREPARPQPLWRDDLERRPRSWQGGGYARVY
jgi:hypothetical protein